MDGNQLDQESPESQEEQYSCYLAAIYSNRLKWTGHAIPVSFIYYGLRIEGYIFTVAKVTEEEKNIEVKVAFIGNKIPYSVYVPFRDILPSTRKFYATEDNSSFKPILPFDIELTVSEAFSEWKMLRIPVVLPGISFTKAEIASMLQTEESLVISEHLHQVEDKYCLITGEKSPAFNIEMSKYSPNESLVELTQEYTSCQLCDLGIARIKDGRNIVFGRKGSAPKSLGFILAEAPGVMEEKDMIPLHPKAPAGDVLYRVMTKAGLSQDDFYLTNSVICRPLPKEGDMVQNGKPTSEHIKCCSTRLKRTLRIISPKVVVLLGGYAFQAWFGYEPPGGISKNIGDKTIYKDGAVVNYLTYVTYHPSYIARQESNTAVKAAYLNDWINIKKMIESVR